MGWPAPDEGAAAEDPCADPEVDLGRRGSRAAAPPVGRTNPLRGCARFTLVFRAPISRRPSSAAAGQPSRAADIRDICNCSAGINLIRCLHRALQVICGGCAQTGRVELVFKSTPLAAAAAAGQPSISYATLDELPSQGAQPARAAPGARRGRSSDQGGGSAGCAYLHRPLQKTSFCGSKTGSQQGG